MIEFHGSNEYLTDHISYEEFVTAVCVEDQSWDLKLVNTVFGGKDYSLKHYHLMEKVMFTKRLT